MGHSASQRSHGTGKQRIAMIAYTHYRTDPRCRREATTAAAAGWEVHFYALSRDGRARTEETGGIVLHELSLDRYRGAHAATYLLSYFRFLVLASWAVLADHIRRRFRIVHVNTMPDFMVLTALLPRLLGAKVILDIHDVMPELYMAKFDLPATHWKPSLVRNVEVFSARMAHAVLTAEHPKGELLVQHGIPREKIEVLLNLPDDGIFTPDLAAPAAKETDSTDLSETDSTAEFRLIYHGTVAHRHGLDYVIEAVAHLAGRIPELKLSILGEGDHLPQLHDQVERLGLEGRVCFSNAFRPIEEIIPAIRASHLAVIPTRPGISTDYMLPTKLLEYLAVGVTAIFVPTKTVRHYFGDRHPLYIERPSPEAVAEKILWVRENREEAGHLTAALRETFFRRYSWSSHKRVYIDLIERLAR